MLEKKEVTNEIAIGYLQKDSYINKFLFIYVNINYS